MDEKKITLEDQSATSPSSGLMGGLGTFNGPAAGSVIFSSPFATVQSPNGQSRLIAVADGNFHTRGTAVRPTLPRAPKEGRIRDTRIFNPEGNRTPDFAILSRTL